MIVIALITLTVIPSKMKTTVKHNMFDGSIKIQYGKCGPNHDTKLQLNYKIL